MDVNDLVASDIMSKWIHWYCISRLHLISLDVDALYKPGDVWAINEDMFRRGMRLEAVCICSPLPELL